MIKQASVW